MPEAPKVTQLNLRVRPEIAAKARAAAAREGRSVASYVEDLILRAEGSPDSFRIGYGAAQSFSAMALLVPLAIQVLGRDKVDLLLRDASEALPEMLGALPRRPASLDAAAGEPSPLPASFFEVFEPLLEAYQAR